VIAPPEVEAELVRGDEDLGAPLATGDLVAPGDRIALELRAAGIGSQVHYIPVHTQPYYRGLYPRHELPGAQAWYERTLSLPLFPGMDDDDPDRVVAALLRALSPVGG